jgi:hypothetical protein
MNMVKNLLMGGKKPVVAPPSVAAPPFAQRGGKMKVAGLGKKARKVAEEVPTGPMKGVK